MNLINGANGFGKTSLLEAVEYLLTGTINRSPEENLYEIHAGFKSAHPSIASSADNNNILFRERDAVWYNAHSRFRGSSLNRHFNRFNFFNTDAAFNLSSSSDQEDEILGAIRDIALGEDVNSLRKQIDRYRDKLQEELRHDEETVAMFTGEKNRLESNLASERPSETPIEDLLNEVNTLSLSIGIGIKSSSSPDHSKNLIEILEFKSSIDSLISNSFWLDSPSLDDLKNEDNKLEILLGSIFKINEEIKKNAENESRLLAEKDEVNNQLQVLRSILPYYEHEYSGVIIGLRQSLEDQRVSLGKIKRLKANYENLPSASIDNEIISEAVIRLEDELKKDELSLAAKEVKILESQELLERYDMILAGLRSDGEEFLKLAENKKECPLCHTIHSSPAELTERIRSTIGDNVLRADLSRYLDERRTINDRLDKNRAKNDFVQGVIGIIDEIDQSLQGLEWNEADKAIQEYFAKERDLISSSKSLATALDEIELRGLSEYEFVELRDEIIAWSESENEKIDTAWISQRVSGLDIVLTDILENFRLTSNDIQTNKDTIRKKIEEYDSSISASDPVDMIRQRRKLLQNGLAEITSKGNQFISDQPLSQITFVCERITSLLSEINNLKENLSQYDELKSRNSIDYERVSTNLGERGVVMGRTEEALEVLEYLTTAFDPDKYLTDFFEKNLTRIKQIFIAIHKPSEFVGLELEDGKIKLSRRDENDAYSHTISSGQRSALALSIFLALNEQLRDDGPIYMLFDDPVTFVDDLNVLLFFDYLREIALVKNRQIFFATANQNVSFLFRQKFRIFGDDFQEITLRRSE